MNRIPNLLTGMRLVLALFTFASLAGGGKRGVNLHVNGADLVRHLGAEVADVTRAAE